MGQVYLACHAASGRTCGAIPGRAPRRSVPAARRAARGPTGTTSTSAFGRRRRRRAAPRGSRVPRNPVGGPLGPGRGPGGGDPQPGREAVFLVLDFGRQPFGLLVRLLRPHGRLGGRALGDVREGRGPPVLGDAPCDGQGRFRVRVVDRDATSTPRVPQAVRAGLRAVRRRGRRNLSFLRPRRAAWAPPASARDRSSLGLRRFVGPPVSRRSRRCPWSRTCRPRSCRRRRCWRPGP